jgi:hypothetical protein
MLYTFLSLLYMVAFDATFLWAFCKRFLCMPIRGLKILNNELNSMDASRLPLYMFAARRLHFRPLHHRRPHLSLRPSYVPRKSQRTLFTSAVETLAEEFLDLALALPLPSSLPPYSTTIILFTVVSRLAFTLPFSIWVRVWKRSYSLLIYFAFRLTNADTRPKK